MDSEKRKASKLYSVIGGLQYKVSDETRKERLRGAAALRQYL